MSPLLKTILRLVKRLYEFHDHGRNRLFTTWLLTFTVCLLSHDYNTEKPAIAPPLHLSPLTRTLFDFCLLLSTMFFLKHTTMALAHAWLLYKTGLRFAQLRRPVASRRGEIVGKSASSLRLHSEPFPRDVIQHVFEMLNHRELLRVATVSRTWSVAASRPALWRQLWQQYARHLVVLRARTSWSTCTVDRCGLFWHDELVRDGILSVSKSTTMPRCVPVPVMHYAWRRHYQALEWVERLSDCFWYCQHWDQDLTASLTANLLVKAVILWVPVFWLGFLPQIIRAQQTTWSPSALTVSFVLLVAHWVVICFLESVHFFYTYSEVVQRTVPEVYAILTVLAGAQSKIWTEMAIHDFNLVLQQLHHMLVTFRLDTCAWRILVAACWLCLCLPTLGYASKLRRIYQSGLYPSDEALHRSCLLVARKRVLIVVTLALLLTVVICWPAGTDLLCMLGDINWPTCLACYALLAFSIHSNNRNAHWSWNFDWGNATGWELLVPTFGFLVSALVCLYNFWSGTDRSSNSTLGWTGVALLLLCSALDVLVLHFECAFSYSKKVDGEPRQFVLELIR